MAKIKRSRLQQIIKEEVHRHILLQEETRTAQILSDSLHTLYKVLKSLEGPVLQQLTGAGFGAQVIFSSLKSSIDLYNAYYNLSPERKKKKRAGLASMIGSNFTEIAGEVATWSNPVLKAVTTMIPGDLAGQWETAIKALVDNKLSRAIAGDVAEAWLAAADTD